MSREMTIQEWIDKADYEGGLMDGFEYGLTVDDLKDTPSEIYDAVLACQDAAVAFHKAESVLNEVLSDFDIEREVF